ncbi:transposase [Erythrobacter ani]|uniref:IS1595 family transposase n=1 Tax=Erythrobacter ani TaxID=2827235 RepID=A0ABS6SSS3_9SPHN|nr:transposase [Erythrobacter ani]MBV7267542.1 IS1595 family transposase [Erythrobacter ani]
MPFDLGYPSHDYLSDRPGYRGTSLQSVFARFPSESSCLKYVLETRFGHMPICRCCGQAKRFYRRSTKRYFQAVCGDAISPLAHTIFHATKLPLSLWFYAMLHVSNSAQGVNALFLERHLGIGSTAAVRMLKRIRLHLAAIDTGTLIDPVDKRIEIRLDRWRVVRSINRRRNRNATVCFLSNGDRVDATVVTRPRRPDLRRLMRDKTMSSMIPFTTCYQTYRAYTHYGFRDSGIEYLPTYYIDKPNAENAIQSFLNYSMQSLKGQHKCVSQANLWLYLKEFEFRFNRRSKSHRIFWEMIGAFPMLGNERATELATWHSR